MASHGPSFHPGRSLSVCDDRIELCYFPLALFFINDLLLVRRISLAFDFALYSALLSSSRRCEPLLLHRCCSLRAMSCGCTVILEL